MKIFKYPFKNPRTSSRISVNSQESQIILKNLSKPSRIVQNLGTTSQSFKHLQKYENKNQRKANREKKKNFNLKLTLWKQPRIEQDTHIHRKKDREKGRREAVRAPDERRGRPQLSAVKCVV